jgi:hypothetical protein
LRGNEVSHGSGYIVSFNHFGGQPLRLSGVAFRGISPEHFIHGGHDLGEVGHPGQLRKVDTGKDCEDLAGQVKQCPDQPRPGGFHGLSQCPLLAATIWPDRLEFNRQQTIGKIAPQGANVNPREQQHAAIGEHGQAVIGIEPPADVPIAGNGAAYSVSPPGGNRRHIVNGGHP